MTSLKRDVYLWSGDYSPQDSKWDIIRAFHMTSMASSGILWLFSGAFCLTMNRKWIVYGLTAALSLFSIASVLVCISVSFLLCDEGARLNVDKGNVMEFEYGKGLLYFCVGSGFVIISNLIAVVVWRPLGKKEKEDGRKFIKTCSSSSGGSTDEV